jgi:hypothetical protein
MLVVEFISLFEGLSLLLLLAISKSHELIVIDVLALSVLIVGDDRELV